MRGFQTHTEQVAIQFSEESPLSRLLLFSYRMIPDHICKARPVITTCILPFRPLSSVFPVILTNKRQLREIRPTVSICVEKRTIFTILLFLRLPPSHSIPPSEGLLFLARVGVRRECVSVDYPNIIHTASSSSLSNDYPLNPDSSCNTNCMPEGHLRDNFAFARPHIPHEHKTPNSNGYYRMGHLNPSMADVDASSSTSLYIPFIRSDGTIELNPSRSEQHAYYLHDDVHYSGMYSSHSSGIYSSSHSSGIYSSSHSSGETVSASPRTPESSMQSSGSSIPAKGRFFTPEAERGLSANPPRRLAIPRDSSFLRH